MSKKFNLYVGKAGQLYVMSEFLMRGWNVAMPEVDTGDDIFVVEDENDTFYRVQVKTAQAAAHANSYSAQFSVPLRQLKEYEPAVYFIFAIRRNSIWSDMLLISQNQLYDLFKDHNVGSIVKENLILYFSFANNKVTCKKQDFTAFVNNFSDFPIVEH
jgi:hypothetical protein